MKNCCLVHSRRTFGGGRFGNYLCPGYATLCAASDGGGGAFDRPQTLILVLTGSGPAMTRGYVNGFVGWYQCNWNRNGITNSILLWVISGGGGGTGCARATQAVASWSRSGCPEPRTNVTADTLPARSTTKWTRATPSSPRLWAMAGYCLKRAI